MPPPRLLLASVALAWAAGSARADDFFEKHVRPVLAEHCFKCHGDKKQRGGIRLDAPDHLASVPDGSGPLVVPGKPDESRLVRAVRHEGEHEMPPNGKLPDATVKAFAEWVRAGAKWPAKAAPAPAKEHWAFKPVGPVSPPAVKDTAWPASTLDHFILAKLEAKGLKPSPPADKRTLLRRVTFDLTGLPPTIEEADAFLADTSEGAYAAAVDRLLNSPRFGERWGRHWLDAARYADTKGPILFEDNRYPFAYTYRDWVVKAFNDDLPYDQFLIKQVAADHLTRAEAHPDLAALGFLSLGRKFENSEPDVIDDRLDALFRATQALTIACARCHDHKYDPIPIKDYYSLYGVFADAKERDVPLVGSFADRQRYQAFAAELRARIRSSERFREAERRRVFGNHRQQAEQHLLAAVTKGGEPKEGQVKRPDGLHQAMVNLYKSFLDQTKAAHHPILAPWHGFAALKPERFATEGKWLAAALAANEDAEKPLNPLVARLFAGKPPASQAEVAQRYGRLFGTVARKWERKVAEADRTDTDRPTQLEDEGEEEVRQVIYGDFAPLDDRSAGSIRDFLDPEKLAKHDELTAAVDAWRLTPEAPPHARILVDPEQPNPARVFVRGKAYLPGDEVPRQFLAELAGPVRTPFTDGTGRYELAKAIARKENPLTARVWANRVWGHLFGRGLVATASDFGRRAEPPTHPELLDWLAGALVEKGWSTKQLIREIVLSRAYRQASAERSEARAADPANSLSWRMNRKRLELEPMRDALLAVAGNLDLTTGGRPVAPEEQARSRRRTIYLAVDRGNLPAWYRVFDFANPDLHSPARHETTVPQQALFLLNSPFPLEQARALARRADAAKPADDAAWVRQVYRLALGREPSEGERAGGVKFLAEAAGLQRAGPADGAEKPLSPKEKFAQVLLMSNEFLYVD